MIPPVADSVDESGLTLLHLFDGALERGFEVVAVFDKDPDKVGAIVAGPSYRPRASARTVIVVVPAFRRLVPGLPNGEPGMVALK